MNLNIHSIINTLKNNASSNEILYFPENQLLNECSSKITFRKFECLVHRRGQPGYSLDQGRDHGSERVNWLSLIKSSQSLRLKFWKLIFLCA